MKTYIVLPYKDRNGKYEKALGEFINPFIDYLGKCLSDFEVIIVEQKNGSLNTNLPGYYSGLISNRDEEFFNLGRTINIGFDLIKERISDDDIFMFHPVDLMPVDVDYNCINTTKLCFREHSPEGYFYKSIAFKSSDFKMINGFSNNYWGWGLEDDDLFVRLKSKNIIPRIKVDNYKRLASDGNGETDDEHYMPLYEFNHRFTYQIKSTNDCLISGLNTLHYKLISVENYNNINKYIVE